LPRTADPATASDLEKLRGLYAEWARGDFSRTEIFHPEVVSRSYGIWPGGETETRGIEEVTAASAGWLESWERPFVIEAEEFIESGPRIAVRVRWRGKARWGGATVESENTHLWELDGGQATRFDVYGEHEQALAALRSE
jgi:ketosteroid isomerase-like protein